MRLADASSWAHWLRWDGLQPRDSFEQGKLPITRRDIASPLSIGVPRDAHHRGIHDPVWMVRRASSAGPRLRLTWQCLF